MQIPSLKSFGFQIRPKKAAPRPDLPLEIQFLILDELGDDVLELRDLSFVCCAWGAHAKRMIFRTIWVTPANVEQLFAVIDSKPEIGRYVRTLRAIAGRHNFQETPLLLEKLVQNLPNLMPNVRTLDLLEWRSEPVIQSVANVAGITHLRIRPGTFKNADNMVRFIALFPRLDALDVFWQAINSDSRTISPQPPAPRRLKYLGLSNNPASSSGVIVAWLWQSGTVTVDELRLTEYGCNHTGMVHFLRKIGDRVQHLELVEDLPHWSTEPVLRGFRLPPCPSLQTLTMSLHASTADSSSLRAGLLTVLHALSSGAPPLHLRSMHFDTYVMTARGHVDLPWDEVDAALSVFPGLRSVVFDLYGRFDYSGALGTDYYDVPGVGRARVLGYHEICEEMRGKMPRCCARGILQFRLAGRRDVKVVQRDVKDVRRAVKNAARKGIIAG
ncbi:hypothetical protein C8R43DRAFT_967023 [Mycena crocata]|nr:hypothetical protein C8R43DRAFT_967023 [Mycena crocata]